MIMNSRERIMAAWNGEPVDHVPLTTWSFGFNPLAALKWSRNDVTREFWYSLRLEHLHRWEQPWDLDDDFRRVLAWRSLGVDDILDVSAPWSVDSAVTWTDSIVPVGEEDPAYPVLLREYETPTGKLRHAVRQTGEDQEAGWVVQPDVVPLIEDFNIPRAVEHAVSGPDDVRVIQHLYQPPDSDARAWFADRMSKVHEFAAREQVPVQVWSGFGMDAVVWFTGVEGAIMLAMDHPGAFGELFHTITATDLARTEMAASTEGVDMVVARGWYSSTDLWSPALFEQFTFPYIKAIAETAHRHGKKFGYVMTTGVETLGGRLADAGVDVLYFVDPVQDTISLETARDLLGDRLTIVGGINTVSLNVDSSDTIRDKVLRAVDILGPTSRFILHPVDALFPDTPWSAIEAMIEAWKSTH